MNDKQNPTRYFHGGHDGLLVGEYILPPAETGADNMADLNPLLRKDRVYITTNIASAMFFASAARNPMVYEVTPEGGVEDDPDSNEKGVSFACLKAKIIALHTVPEAVVQRNRLQMRVAGPVPKP